MVAQEKSDRPSQSDPPYQDAANAVAEARDSDVLFVNGPLFRPLDLEIIDLCRGRTRRTNLLFILVTEGGDADAAYRVARCLQRTYERISFFVTGYCKSAGTLVALGAHELVVADEGELGPLDVQMQKEDELWESRSGLTVLSGLSTLHNQAFQAFEHFFLRLKAGSRSIRTKTASQIAVELTGSLFAPIYEHVDPMHVGEAGRALEVAAQYGRNLLEQSNNMDLQGLMRLTREYPTHGYIIDREEASKLFRSVRAPDANEHALAKALGQAGRSAGDEKPIFLFLNTEFVAEPGLPLGHSAEQPEGPTSTNDIDTEQPDTEQAVAGGKPQEAAAADRPAPLREIS